MPERVQKKVYKNNKLARGGAKSHHDLGSWGDVSYESRASWNEVSYSNASKKGGRYGVIIPYSDLVSDDSEGSFPPSSRPKIGRSWLANNTAVAQQPLDRDNADPVTGDGADVPRTPKTLNPVDALVDVAKKLGIGVELVSAAKGELTLRVLSDSVLTSKFASRIYSRYVKQQSSSADFTSPQLAPDYFAPGPKPIRKNSVDEEIEHFLAEPNLVSDAKALRARRTYRLRIKGPPVSEAEDARELRAQALLRAAKRKHPNLKL